ncbi:MAG: hypothetical protein ABMA64_16515 [Myxococcota bacterium]
MFTLLSTALAATYDPELHWRTLSTEHFDIHFHQGVEPVAEAFSQRVEPIYDTMTAEVGWTPRPRIQVVLVDRTDAANGFATAIPYPSITVYVTAPTEGSVLNLYEDWDEAIFTHELTHVLHMDTNHGIVRATRAVVGRVASTNSVSPLWMIEGYATFEETRYTDGGRGRAALPEMLKRTAVLSDEFPPIGNLDGFQPSPPSGNLRYLWGQDFISYLTDQKGPQVFTDWVHTYGGWVPFWLPTKRVFGQSLHSLYQGWKAESYARYEAQAAAIRAEGETIGRIVSDPSASCVAPAYSPDGDKLVWSCYDLQTGSAIWMSDGDGYAPELLLQNNGASYFTWRSDSQAFVFAALHLVNQFNTWSDIYLYPLGGTPTALTSGARARDPDFSPDGTELWYVTNEAQNNQLERMTVDRRRTALTANDDQTQYSTPRFSPDGELVALSVWADGQRDLWLYDRDGAPARRLTMDKAIDADPMWSHDGKWLYFDSDRSGVPNVYAIELATERLYQVTHVVTGAVKPSLHPSGKAMAYMQYSQDGWDVAILDLDPAKYLDRGLLPRPTRHAAPLAERTPIAADTAHWTPPADARPDRPSAGAPFTGLGAVPGVGPAAFGVPDPIAAGARGLPPVARQGEVLDNFGDVNVEDAFGEEQDYPFTITPKAYDPSRSLLPRYVLPYFQLTPYQPGPDFGGTCLPGLCRGLQVTLSTSATDALTRYGWGAALSYRTDAQYLGGAFGVTINRFLPVYSFGVSTQAVVTGQLQFTDPAQLLAPDGSLQVFTTDPPTFYWEERSTAYAVVSWPYRLRSTVFAQYSFTDRRPRFDLPTNTYRPAVPFVGTVGALSGGYRYSWSEPTAYAISTEDGRLFSFVGSVRAPWLGSFDRDLDTGDRAPFSQVQLTAELREYRTVPYLDNHVVAVRAAAGASLGTTDFFGNYLLGGNIGDSGFLATPDEFRMVRGYPYAFDIGDLYWLAEGEYRLPLLRIERGARTLPFYARTVSGAVFVDVANAFVDPALGTGVPPTGRELLAAATEAPLVGVGAEVSFRMIVGWSSALTGRVGYGVGLTEGGYRPEPGAFGWANPLYLQLGGSF